jgi:hypothetical protein
VIAFPRPRHLPIARAAHRLRATATKRTSFLAGVSMGIACAVPATLVTGLGAAAAELRLALLAGAFALASAVADRAHATRGRGSTLTRRPDQRAAPSARRLPATARRAA